MTRVQSQRTRQALLVVGQSMEESPPPERLELFTEDGVAVDVGKDRTRARWRGTWVGTPEAPYENNDFVLDQDKLWILDDVDLLETATAPSASTSGAWVLMTVSGGMTWGGTYDPDVDYEEHVLISHEGGLYISTAAIPSGSPVPGAVPAPPATGTTKAGDAMFGGHIQPCRIAVKGELIDPLGGLLGGETNIGQAIGSRFVRVNAIPGDQVTLEWTGGSITLFDGGGGDSLFPSSPNPPGSSVAVGNSPLTFTVPATTPNTTVPNHVCIEVAPGVDTFLWVGDEADGTWESVIQPAPDDKMRWVGAWADDVPYVANDVVYFESAIYIAPGDISIGQDPNYVLADPLVATNRSVPFYSHHRIGSTSPVTKTIDASDIPSDFTSPYKCEPILVDQTSGDHTVTIYNDHPTKILKVDKRNSGGSQIGSATQINPGSNATFPTAGSVASGADYFMFVYYEDGSLGDFRAKVDSLSGLNLPPDPDFVSWEKILDGASGSTGAMVYSGAWTARDYVQGEVVTLAGKTYVAPVNLTADVTPGADVSDPVLSTTKGVVVRQSDRLKSTAPVVRTISASSDVTDTGSPVASGNKGKGVMLDRNGASSQVITIKNLHDTSNLYAKDWTPDNFAAGGTPVNIAPGATATISTPNGSWDVVVVLGFVNSGALGSFEISTTNITTLTAPPDFGPQWVEL